MLTQEQIKGLKEKLEAEKESLEGQLSKFARKDDSIPGNYKTKFPDFGDENEENADEVTEYEKNLNREHSLEEEITLINKALGKINEGKYGFCENCQEEIPMERLEIRPQAQLCVVCKGKKE